MTKKIKELEKVVKKCYESCNEQSCRRNFGCTGRAEHELQRAYKEKRDREERAKYLKQLAKDIKESKKYGS